ncbi:MAG: hypothetical protein ACHP65_08475 [Legionellales bacterium]
MNKLQLTGAVLAVGVASIFAVAPAFAVDAAPAAPMVQCKDASGKMTEVTKEVCLSVKGSSVVEKQAE